MRGGGTELLWGLGGGATHSYLSGQVKLIERHEPLKAATTLFRSGCRALADGGPPEGGLLAEG
jgi:hypothetical protein